MSVSENSDSGNPQRKNKLGWQNFRLKHLYSDQIIKKKVKANEAKIHLGKNSRGMNLARGNECRKHSRSKHFACGNERGKISSSKNSCRENSCRKKMRLWKFVQ